MASLIMARTDTAFPADLAASRKMLDALDAELRAEGARLEAEAQLRGSSFRWPEAFAEKQRRRMRLQFHVQELIAAAETEKAIAAANAPARAPRPIPQPIEPPAKPKGLRASEKVVADARAALDAAELALREFSQREHRDTYRAARDSIPLVAARDAAQRALKDAMAKAEAEAAPWREACAAWIEVEFTRRRLAVLALIDAMEDELLPLADAGRAARLDHRRLDQVRGIAHAIRELRRVAHAAR